MDQQKTSLNSGAAQGVAVLPETSELKRSLIEKGAELTALEVLIEQYHKQILKASDEQTVVNLFLKRAEAEQGFFNTAGFILQKVSRYVTTEDKADFDKYLNIFWDNENHRDIEIVRALSLFIEKILKEANISELGYKSKYKMIEERL